MTGRAEEGKASLSQSAGPGPRGKVPVAFEEDGGPRKLCQGPAGPALWLQRPCFAASAPPACAWRPQGCAEGLPLLDQGSWAGMNLTQLEISLPQQTRAVPFNTSRMSVLVDCLFLFLCTNAACSLYATFISDTHTHTHMPLPSPYAFVMSAVVMPRSIFNLLDLR